MGELCKAGRKKLFLLSSAKLLSGFSAYLYDVGIVIYLFDETQSVAVIGGFLVSQLLPAFLILLSGEIIDRYDRKKLAIVSNLVKASLFLLLTWNQGVWVIYAVTFFYNLLLEFESNTHQVLMASLFEKERLFKAASAVNMCDSLSMVIAPVSAAFLAAYASFQANLLLASLLFLLSAAILGFLKLNPGKMESGKECVKGRRGYLAIFRDKRMRGTILFWNLFMLCIGVTGPLEVSMIEETLGMPSSYYGIGNTVEGIGMLLASGVVLGMIGRLKPKDIIAAGLLCSAFSYLVIGISGRIEIYLIGAGLVGMTSTFCPLGFKTEIQLHSPETVLGRTFTTARSTVLLSRIAGAFLAGAAFEAFGIREIYFAVFGILAMAAIGYAVWNKPASIPY